jgi:hypothetical protein
MTIPIELLPEGRALNTEAQGASVLVVGDEYSQFARNAGVLTITELRKLLHGCQRLPAARVWLGQGLDLETRKWLATAGGMTIVAGDVYPVASTEQTHKRRPEHVLITEVQSLGERRYQCGLAIGEGRDRLGDHVTGQHLAAMLLMEAARQAVIAVLESEYLLVRTGDWGIVLERFDSRYVGYAFPIPTLMLIRVEPRVERSDRQVSATTVVDFLQAGKATCQMQLDVTLRENAALEKIEARRARQVLDALKAQTRGDEPEGCGT